ncbi:MAG: LysR family transcriptional regulator [Firmicutes bacterium]|nr:LysR family transcriptional regulator [Bacillota bacterium]
MTQQEIEAFLETVHQGSISAAAETFFITQPALSRRISILEEELGYTLFFRRKGSRNVELTEEGKAFLPIARKTLQLWKEATSVPNLINKALLNITAVPSITSYVLSGVLRRYLKENPTGRVHSSHCHTFEGYGYVEKATADIALVTHKLYSNNVETLPAYREKMFFVTNRNADYPAQLDAHFLDPAKELRVSWMPEYDNWHDSVFPTNAPPLVYLEQMSMLEDFLTDNNWAIMPATAAYRMRSNGNFSIGELQNGPPDRVTYYLKRTDDDSKTIGRFLECLHKEIVEIDGVTSFLG